MSNAYREMTEEDFKNLGRSVWKYIISLEKAGKECGNNLFNDLNSLEEATMKGLIPFNVFLNEYKRMKGVEDKDE